MGRQLAAFEHAAGVVEASVRDYQGVNEEIRESQSQLDEGNFEVEVDDAPPAYADKLYKDLEKQAKKLRANKRAMQEQKEWLLSQIPPPEDPSLLPPVLSDPTLRRLERSDGEFGIRDTPIQDREVAEFLLSLGGGLRDRLRAEALTPSASGAGSNSNSNSGSGSGRGSRSSRGTRSRRGSMSESGRSRSGSRRRGSRSGSGSGSGSGSNHNWEGESRYRQESQGNY